MKLSIQLPEDHSAKIWRYVDLPKLLSLLEESCLYLSRADLLGDPFEGSFTPRSLDAELVNAGDEYLSNSWRPLLSRLPKWTYVSCWHLAEWESAALWQLYASTSGAVALQSTVAKLISAFPATAERGSEGELRVQDVSTVTYLDYRNDGPDLSFTSGPYICTRASFAHEREIRAVLQILPAIPKDRGKRAINLSAPDGSPGIRNAIVPAEFLDAIYISPTAPAWYSHLLVALLKKYGLPHLECRKSNLLDEPFF